MEQSFSVLNAIFLRLCIGLFYVRTLLFCALFSNIVERTACFNIDMRTAVLHQGPNGSMFGYSLTMHRDKDFSW